MVQPARLEGPISVGELAPPADPRPLALDAIGYVQEEFFASGTATAYVADELADDGHWVVSPASAAPFTTRIVVRRPRDPARFSGTVVVEWLNVSVVETAPGWAFTSRTIVDAGAAWVGVSVQALGVEGGTSLIQTGDPNQEELDHGLKALHPERYASLVHPGDQYSFDIFSEVAAALRSPGAVPVFGHDRRPDRVLAMGESQSAGFLTTYINAVEPITEAFDGFLVHSRGFGAAGLDGSSHRTATVPARFRTDLVAPVMVFETETDVGPVLGYAWARQPDAERLRVWEVAGTAHADAFLVGPRFGPCPHPVNAGPQHYVLNAALEALLRWVSEGTAPPHGQRLETVSEFDTTIVRDEAGNAIGGIRTPLLDVPVATLSGDPAEGSDVLCSLFGVTIPFEEATLAALYANRQTYLDAFDTSLGNAIAAGFVRPADRDLFAAEARAVEF